MCSQHWTSFRGNDGFDEISPWFNHSWSFVSQLVSQFSRKVIQILRIEASRWTFNSNKTSSISVDITTILCRRSGFNSVEWIRLVIRNQRQGHFYVLHNYWRAQLMTLWILPNNHWRLFIVLEQSNVLGHYIPGNTKFDFESSVNWKANEFLLKLVTPCYYIVTQSYVPYFPHILCTCMTIRHFALVYLTLLVWWIILVRGCLTGFPDWFFQIWIIHLYMYVVKVGRTICNIWHKFSSKVGGYPFFYSTWEFLLVVLTVDNS